MRWEYLTRVADSLLDLESGSNHVGADGWELVAVWSLYDGCLHAIYKRPRP